MTRVSSILFSIYESRYIALEFLLLISLPFIIQCGEFSTVSESGLNPSTLEDINISHLKISPEGCKVCGRGEIISVGDKLFMAFMKKEPLLRFKLVELNKDLTYKSEVFDLFSDAISEDVNYMSIDIHLSTDGTNLWYGFESVPLKHKNGMPYACDNRLGIAKYNVSGETPVLLNSKQDIITNGCPTNPQAYIYLKDHPEFIPENPVAVDDPAIFWFNNQYVIMARGWRNQKSKIITFDESFNEIARFTLDLATELGQNALSQNSLVNIDGQAYLIGGFFNGPPTIGSSDIYAIPLTSDLRAVHGAVIPLLIDSLSYLTRVTKTNFIDGKLFINYHTNDNSSLKHYIGAFDVNRNFSKLNQIQIQQTFGSAHHTCFNIIENKLISLYPGDNKGIPDSEEIFATVYDLVEFE